MTNWHLEHSVHIKRFLKTNGKDSSIQRTHNLWRDIVQTVLLITPTEYDSNSLSRNDVGETDRISFQKTVSIDIQMIEVMMMIIIIIDTTGFRES